MSHRFALYEALADLRATAPVLVSLHLGALLAAGVFSGVVAANVTAQALALRDSGATVWVVSPEEGSVIPGDHCAAISEHQGVLAAGGATAVHATGWRTFAGANVLPSLGVTPGALAVWGSTITPTEPLIGNQLVDLQLAGEGQRLFPEDAGAGEPITVRVLSKQLPYTRLDSVVLIPGIPKRLALVECWVRFEPASFPAGDQVIRAALPDQRVMIAPFLEVDSIVASPARQWAAFTASQPWLLAALFTGLGSGILYLGRRPTLAVYKAMGAPRTAVALMLCIQTVVILAAVTPIAVVLGWLTTVLIVPNSTIPEVLAATALQVAAAALASLSTCAVAAWVAAGGRTMRQLRDR